MRVYLLLTLFLIGCSNLPSRGPASAEVGTCTLNMQRFLDRMQLHKHFSNGIEIEGVVDNSTEVYKIPDKMFAWIKKYLNKPKLKRIKSELPNVVIYLHEGREYKWLIVDESLGTPYGKYGMEINSPIMYTEDDYIMFKAFMGDLESMGFEQFVDGSGLHIHFGHGLINDDSGWEVVKAFEKIETDFREFFGTINTRRDIDRIDVAERNRTLKGMRYNSRHGTVELRLLNGIFETEQVDVAKEFMEKFLAHVLNKNPRLMSYLESGNIDLLEVSRLIDSVLHKQKTVVNKAKRLAESRAGTMVKNFIWEQYHKSERDRAFPRFVKHFNKTKKHADKPKVTLELAKDIHKGYGSGYLSKEEAVNFLSALNFKKNINSDNIYEFRSLFFVIGESDEVLLDKEVFLQALRKVWKESGRDLEKIREPGHHYGSYVLKELLEAVDDPLVEKQIREHDPYFYTD